MYSIRLSGLAFSLTCVAAGQLIAPTAYAQASSGPAECASNVGFSIQHKDDLCKNGGTLETAKCANGVNFSIQHKVDLCKNGGTLETAKCANNVGFSIQQKIDRCSRSKL